MSELAPDDIFCGRCKEDFPLAQPPPKGFQYALQMGNNYPMSAMPRRVKNRFTEWRDWKFMCGNCYFDLTDTD